MPISNDAAHILNAVFSTVYTLWPDFMLTCAHAAGQSAGHADVFPRYDEDITCPIGPRILAPHTSPLRNLKWVAKPSYHLYNTANGVLRRTCDDEHPAFHSYGGRPTANGHPWTPSHWRCGFFTHHTTVHPLGILHFAIRIESTIGRKSHSDWTLDRIQVNNGYGDECNLRWASDATQQTNKQSLRLAQIPDADLLYKLLPKRSDRRTWQRIAQALYRYIIKLGPGHKQNTILRMLRIHKP